MKEFQDFFTFIILLKEIEKGKFYCTPELLNNLKLIRENRLCKLIYERPKKQKKGWPIKELKII